MNLTASTYSISEFSFYGMESYNNRNNVFVKTLCISKNLLLIAGCELYTVSEPITLGKSTINFQWYKICLLYTSPSSRD